MTDLRPVIAASAVCALAVTAPATAVTASRIDRAGSTLTGHLVTVECVQQPDPDTGYAYAATVGHTIKLAPAVCGPLRNPSADDPDLAWRVEIVAHELGHTLLGKNELRAECYGMAHWRRLGRLLGMSFTRAQTLALAWRHAHLPDNYVGRCVPAWWAA